MKWTTRIGLALFFAMLPFVAFDLVADEAVLRTAASIAEQLSRWGSGEQSFDLTARVDCTWDSDSTNNSSMSISDVTGAVVVKGIRLNACPCAGDIVRCTGKVMRLKTQYRPSAVATHVEILEHTAPPELAKATIREILDGCYDYRFVRFSGILRDARRSETSYPWMLLTIGDGHSVIYTSVLAYETGPEHFADMLGAVISVEGACSPFNIGYRRQLGRSFKATSLDSIRVLKPPQGGYSNLPDLQEARDLGPEDVLLLDRHRTEGQVLAVWDRDQVLVKAPDGAAVRLHLTHHGKRPACGDYIEAAGYPETDLFHINLNHASWRPIPARPMPKDKVKTISARDLVFSRSGDPQINTDFHGKTVRLRGTVLAVSNRQQGFGRLYLESDSTAVPVCVDASMGDTVETLVGCTVEAVGVCVLESEEWRPNAIFPKLKGFLVVPRSADDLKVLSRPSWLTSGRLLSVIAALLSALAAIFAWNVTLRRLAVRKGRELLRAQLEQVKADLRTEERTRLAVELHDTLAQNLTGVSMEIEAACDLRGDAPQPMLDHLDIAAKALKSCRNELRNSLWDLRSQALDEKSMTTAVLRTLQPHVSDSKLDVRFNVPRARLSDNTAHALLRVIRELVVNATRHGGATVVKVAGAIDEGRLLCSVTDNGTGFDPDRAPGVLQGRFGLQGIRERIAGLGGRFEISSAPGAGAKATIVVPLSHTSVKD